MFSLSLLFLGLQSQSFVHPQALKPLPTYRSQGWSPHWCLPQCRSVWSQLCRTLSQLEQFPPVPAGQALPDAAQAIIALQGYRGTVLTRAQQSPSSSSASNQQLKKHNTHCSSFLFHKNQNTRFETFQLLFSRQGERQMFEWIQTTVMWH